jgi:lysophospholipase L1-like esterase
MKSPESLFSKLFLVFASLLVCFVGLEIGARIWLSHFADESSFYRYASFSEMAVRYGGPLVSKHRYLGYYPTPDFSNSEKDNRHNSLGYRGEEITLPKPADEFRIVCLGGSSTYTISAGYRKSYPYLMEKHLNRLGYSNATVVNAGFLGWTTWESLIGFQFRVLDLDPDMVIVYHAVNDVNARLVWPPEAYEGDNSGYRVETAEPSDFLEHIVLARIFAVRYGLAPSSTHLRSIDAHATTFYGDEFWQQTWDGTFPSGTFRQVSASEILETNDLIYFRRNIENLIAIAESRDIKVLLATFAYTSEIKDPIAGVNDVFQLGIDQANQQLRHIALENGVPLIDFAELFPRDKRYYWDFQHVNEEGSELKAEMFARFLHENSMIPTPK